MKYLKLYEDYFQKLDSKIEELYPNVPNHLKKEWEDELIKNKREEFKYGYIDELPDFNSEEFKNKIKRYIVIKWERYKEEQNKNIEVEPCNNNYPLTPYFKFKDTKNLNKEQVDILYSYKNTNYDYINDMLRDNKKPSIIGVLDSCFINETKEDMIVARMIMPGDFFKKEYIEKGYLSTSCDLDYFDLVKELDNVWVGAIIMKILIPPGIKYIKPSIRMRNDTEEEIIFQRNLNLSFIEMCDGFYIYKAELIDE